ncbi:Acot8 [Symbiodinium necroappetens]|uniref:Acot8 protein n=1 Tax=Symbiodinium necroappetens TaxID=1628268 RepID=A0A813AQF2_9DINO|nr:Acot8 [Symbiodinium necroappetens]CAE7935427.1 Acot8 [Symbiodinium sp. KB8]
MAGSDSGGDASEEDTKSSLEGQRKGAPEGPPQQNVFQAIVLDRIDTNLFLAKPEILWKPPGARAVFGGQVLGQSLAAASQTVAPGLSLHSLHAYFVRAGQPEHPIVYDISRVRDGNSFATRSVAARQKGEWIFTMQASFQRPEGYSVCHQARMPDVPDPESLPTEEERFTKLLHDPEIQPLAKWILSHRKKYVNPIDVRVVLDSLNWHTEEAKQMRVKYALSGLGMPSQLLWFRVRERLPDDEHVHHAVLAYQSDAGLLSTARVEMSWKSFWEARPMMASLDHAMWFHHAFPRWRADEWLLYAMYSPRLTGARGLSHGHIFTRDGWLVVSCTQEGLIRFGKDRGLPPSMRPETKVSKL